MAEGMPLGVATGTVAGRLVGPAMPRRTDLPIAGARVTLTIDGKQMLRAPGATVPTLILPDPVNCTTDADGVLLDERGNPGVHLIATNAPEINPEDLPFLWRATVRAPTVPTVSWTFELPAGTTVDLAVGLLTALQAG